MKVGARTCAKCGKTRGCDTVLDGKYYHFKCALAVRASRAAKKSKHEKNRKHETTESKRK